MSSYVYGVPLLCQCHLDPPSANGYAISKAENPLEDRSDSIDDSFGSLVMEATTAAKSFGSWFKATVNEKAPGLLEKTQQFSQDVFNSSKLVASAAYDKASSTAKRASNIMEDFVDKQRGDPPNSNEEIVTQQSELDGI